MAPKRPSGPSTPSQRKRPRTSTAVSRPWGVATADEEAISASNGLVHRPPRLAAPRSLVSSCLLVLTRNLRRMFIATEQGGGLREEAKWGLQGLPDHLRDRVWDGLRGTGSGLISGDVVAEFFVSTQRIILPGDSLPALANLKKLLPLRLPAYPNRVTHLEISSIPALGDVSVAQAVRQCEGLQSLVLRGTTNVAEKTMTAIVAGKHGSTLRVLNVSGTSVKPTSLVAVLASCLGLEELKMAGLQAVNDHALTNLVDALLVSSRENGDAPLHSLTKLKLRGSKISSLSLAHLLTLTPNLTSLDISLTACKMLPLTAIPGLRKLHLTGSQVTPATLVDLLATSDPRPRLRTLNIGGLPGDWKPQDTLKFSEVLKEMLADEDGLEKMSLQGNPTLFGTGTLSNSAKVESFGEFMMEVGRQSRHLDLSLNPVKSSYLLALSYPDSRIEHLALDETGMDSGLGDVLSGCERLEVLSLKGSKVDPPCLFKILQTCPEITTLDLTSSRGVPLQQRKNFFQVWEEEQARRRADGETFDANGVIHLD